MHLRPCQQKLPNVKGVNKGQNPASVRENIPRAMNVLTRRLARAKACLCYRTNSPSCNFILPLFLFLSFILLKSTPEGMLKSKLELWMQRPPPPAMETKKGSEEEAWLVKSTQARLWIGRKRLIGCELVFALAQ